MMTDPIADMLTRLRNAVMVGNSTVSMPASKLKAGICRILEEQGYIDGFGVAEEGPGKQLTVNLRYGARRSPAIAGLRRISRPGHRVYKPADELPRAKGGLGVVVVSTSQGLLTDSDARRRRLGGEVVCEVW